MTSEELNHLLSSASKVFILTDETVASFWLPELRHWLRLEDAEELVVTPGEDAKTLATAQQLWATMLHQGADRHSVLVNLGGGVITDLGGFVASCYQRGIRFVNVPTTLLAMVDAAIGGKTGVDFDGYKNQIGTFAQPLDILIKPVFLSTLPDRELLSGLAEMLKYGFIADPSMLKIDRNNYEQYILRAGRIKRDIVEADFTENGRRKVLNFGHTLGHAFESYSHTLQTPLTHGEAVAIGMGCALWLSVQRCGLSESVLQDYQPKLKMLLSMAPCSFDAFDADAVMAFLAHDKKNEAGQIRWVLLTEPGVPVYDVEVPEALLRECVLEVIRLLSEMK